MKTDKSIEIESVRIIKHKTQNNKGIKIGEVIVVKILENVILTIDKFERYKSENSKQKFKLEKQ